MQKIIIKKDRLKFQVQKNFIIEINERHFWSRKQGQTFCEAPKCLTDLMEKEGIITRSIGSRIDRNDNKEIDLARPFAEEELSSDGFGNLRIATRHSVNWKWLDATGQYDGAGRVDSRQCSWVPEKIAKDIIKTDAGVLRPFPLQPDPHMKNADGFTQLGSYNR